MIPNAHTSATATSARPSTSSSPTSPISNIHTQVPLTILLLKNHNPNNQIRISA